MYKVERYVKKRYNNSIMSLLDKTKTTIPIIWLLMKLTLEVKL